MDATVPTYLKLNIKVATTYKEYKNAIKVLVWQCQILWESYDLKPYLLYMDCKPRQKINFNMHFCFSRTMAAFIINKHYIL